VSATVYIAAAIQKIDNDVRIAVSCSIQCKYNDTCAAAAVQCSYCNTCSDTSVKASQSDASREHIQLQAL
jgi:hypothetical protein